MSGRYAIFVKRRDFSMQTNPASCKRVLIISYYFPPLYSSGGIRIFKFAKYLPQVGWEPVVVTVKIALGVPTDNTLLEELNKKIQIFRVNNPLNFGIERGINKKISNKVGFKSRLLSKSLNLWKCIKNIISLLFLVPDSFICWALLAYRTGNRIIKEQKIDVVYTTSIPVSTHVVGCLLSRKNKIPWVMEFRDLWFNHVIFAPRKRWRIFIEKKLEKRFFKYANSIIAVTSTILEYFTSSYPNVRNKFATITNGYDSDNFKRAKPSVYKVKDKFTIVYTGTLLDYQTPIYFFEALESLVNENPDVLANIEVVFAGGMALHYQERFSKPPLSSVIKFLGLLPYQEAINLTYSGDTLLLIVYEEMGGNSILTNKLFEYIGARKPILALVPQGVAADLIESEKLGAVVSPRDIQGIKLAILKLYKKWQEKKLYTEANYDRISKKFDRKTLTYKLSKIFDEVSLKSGK